MHSAGLNFGIRVSESNLGSEERLVRLQVGLREVAVNDPFLVFVNGSEN